VSCWIAGESIFLQANTDKGKALLESLTLLEDAEEADVEHARAASRAIMEKHGFKSAAICTSDYHVTRALWLARDAGIPATGISARSPSTLRSFIFGRCRETVSWVLYFLKMI